MKKILFYLPVLFSSIFAGAVPGNVFLEGEAVAVPIPQTAVELRISDIDGNRCFADRTPADGTLELGAVPVGSYRIEYTLPGGKTAVDTLTVLPQPPERLNPDSPIAVDAALFYPFFLRGVGQMKFDYTMDDTIGLLRKAGISYVRERIMWSDFDYLRPETATNPLIDDLAAAYRRHGIKVVPSLYGTPRADQYPEALSALGNKKPPLDLSRLHDYVKLLTERFGNVFPAIETWNEPEGIGGSLLSFEIAAAQKAAMLGAKRANPDQICFMGNGTLENPENLSANDLNAYQNVFCYHNHASLDRTASRAAEYLPRAGSLPVWLTEVSTGSFKIDPATGELPPEAARRQALEIPKVCAQLLGAGADKLFYFFLFHHTEVSGNSFGLLRHRDLMPRPGFATLAVMANYFQNLHSLRPLTELPKPLTGYAAKAVWRENPWEIRLLWSNDGATAFPIGQTRFIRDAFGREVKPVNGMVTVTDLPLYLFSPLSAMPTDASTIAVPKPAEPPSPVVLNLELPDNIKNTTADTFQLPVGEERSFPLVIYNFSPEPVHGGVAVEFPDGEAEPFKLEGIEIPADSHVTRQLVIRLKKDGSGAGSSRLILRGDFGRAGSPLLAANFIPVRAGVGPDDLQTPIPGWQNPTLWKEYIIKESTMTIGSENGAMIFDYRFGEAENRVIAHVWASPTLPLKLEEFPEYVPDAIAFEVRLLEGEGLETMGLNLVESDGATYFGTIPFKPELLRRGQEFLVPLASMINPPFRKKDVNEKLDIEKLTSLELPIWAKPESHIRLEVKNLRWINYKKEAKQMKKLNRTLLTAAAATTLLATAGQPVKNINIANSDFTQARADGTPEKWGISGATPGFSAKITDGALEMKATEKTKWASVYLAPADVKSLPKLNPGETCRLEFRFRQKNENITGHAFGTIEIRDAQHRRLLHRDGSDLPADADWSERTVTLDYKELPAQAKYILLSFFLGEATGTARFDDAKLTISVLPESGK